MSKEMDKVWKDVRKQNFGVFDTEQKKRINPRALAMFWRFDDPEIGDKMREEVALHNDLLVIEENYKEKFGEDCAMDLKLFNKDIELFVERLIRAVEICTLKYALNKGGALNNAKNMNVVKGKNNFIWEW